MEITAHSTFRVCIILQNIGVGFYSRQSLNTSTLPSQLLKDGSLKNRNRWDNIRRMRFMLCLLGRLAEFLDPVDGDTACNAIHTMMYVRDRYTT